VRAGTERVAVTVLGTPAELTVTVGKSGSAKAYRLRPATCETATAVVAAFVTSALAPAPVIAPAPEPAKAAEAPAPVHLDPRTLDAAVREELALREVEFERYDLAIAFSRPGAANFVVRIDKGGTPSC